MADTPETAQDFLEGLTPAESIGVLVTQAIGQAEQERERARATAVRLEQELAATKAHLYAMVDLATRQGTTWAKDDHALSAAAAHLEALAGVESNQSPEQEPTT